MDILLDVDGVLNPIPFSASDSSDWKFESSFISSKPSGRYRLNLSREMGKAIEDIGARIHWLTSWHTHAHFNIGLHFDWIDHPVLAYPPSQLGYGWSGYYGESEDRLWKARAVQRFLAEPGDKVVWVDDEADGLMAKFSNNAGNIDPHNRLLIICPDEYVGLTRSHIGSIVEFFEK
jgi:hypothetical protein